MHSLVPVLSILLVLSASSHQQQLRLLAEWKEVEYEFPSDAERQQALDSQEYVRGNGVSIDMDVDYGGNSTPRVFVTVPRFVGGIPITLGTLTNMKEPGGPLIRGYPSYSWNSNQGSNCNGLTSVFRVAIDDCRRLWVLDSGKIGDTQNCDPQLVVFDLDTDQVVQQYKFPAAQYKIGSSLFITPVVDVRDPTPGTPTTCPRTMVYIADVNGYGLLVYDLQQNRSWRAQNKYLFPTPHAGTFTIAGESFDLMDGVFGLALTPGSGSSQPQRQPASSGNRYPAYRPPFLPVRAPANDAPTERQLYFHTLASTTEIRVPLRILDNATLWKANVEAVPREFVEIGNRGAQSSAEAMDANGNLFFGLVNPIAIGCWDSQRPYDRGSIRVVAQNDETLQFSSGLKIRRNRNGKEELWVLTCRFQKVMTGTISTDEVNFRIQAVEVEQLLGGQTRCSGVGGSAGGILFPRY